MYMYNGRQLGHNITYLFIKHYHIIHITALLKHIMMIYMTIAVRLYDKRVYKIKLHELNH